MNALFDISFAEIDNEAQFEFCQAQIGQRLHLEYLIVFGYGFAFNND